MQNRHANPTIFHKKFEKINPQKKADLKTLRKYLQILFPMRMGRFSRRLQNTGRSQYRDDDTSENRILEDPEKVSGF